MGLAALVAGIIGLPVGSLLNRLIVREPGYVITDPADLPEGADEALLDELEDAPEFDEPVPLLAVVRPGTCWRRWFPVTELVTAGLFALTVHRLGTDAATFAVLVLVSALVTLAAVDLRVYRIPDRINFPAIGIGLASVVVASIVDDRAGAIAGAIGGGVMYAGMLFVAHLVSPRGMGFGDVKLAWLMGIYLGWVGWEDGSLAEQMLSSFRLVLLGAAIGSFAGVVIGGLYALARRSTKAVFPYGPSLALGCLVAVLWSAELT